MHFILCQDVHTLIYVFSVFFLFLLLIRNSLEKKTCEGEADEPGWAKVGRRKPEFPASSAMLRGCMSAAQDSLLREASALLSTNEEILLAFFQSPVSVRPRATGRAIAASQSECLSLHGTPAL